MIYVDERPENFDQVVGQRMVVNNLRNQSIKNKYFNGYIFCGQYGTGKTTMARILAKSENCEHKDNKGNPCCECESCRSIMEGNNPDVIEIDGASNNGVDAARKLIEQVGFKPVGKKKIVIIDECHMLTPSAWNALLKTFEEPPSYLTFILCTTEDNMLPDTIKSRFPVYRFTQLSQDDVAEHIKVIAKKYSISLDEDSVNTITSYASGSMRNALSLLEQLAMQDDTKTIREADIVSLLGINDTEAKICIVESILEEDVKKILHEVGEYERAGKSVSLISKDIFSTANDLVLAKNCGVELVKGTVLYRKHIERLCSLYTDDAFLELIRKASIVKKDVLEDNSVSSFLGSLLSVIADNQTVMKKIMMLEERIEVLSKGRVLSNDAVLDTSVSLPAVLDDSGSEKNNDVDVSSDLEKDSDWYSIKEDEGVPFDEDTSKKPVIVPEQKKESAPAMSMLMSQMGFFGGMSFKRGNVSESSDVEGVDTVQTMSEEAGKENGLSAEAVSDDEEIQCVEPSEMVASEGVTCDDAGTVANTIGDRDISDVSRVEASVVLNEEPKKREHKLFKSGEKFTLSGLIEKMKSIKEDKQTEQENKNKEVSKLEKTDEEEHDCALVIPEGASVENGDLENSCDVIHSEASTVQSFDLIEQMKNENEQVREAVESSELYSEDGKVLILTKSVSDLLILRSAFENIDSVEIEFDM